jgi:hypothetical protein
MIADRATAAGRFPSLARASNDVIDWPSGNTRYVFGASFNEYLARTYGEASLERLANETARQLPYLGSLSFRKVYGKSLGDLWSEYARSIRPSPEAPAEATRLTHHGFTVDAPWHSPGGRLFYAAASPHRFPALFEHTTEGPRQIATQVGATRLGGDRDIIVFDQVEFVRGVAVQADLYAVDLHSRRVRRLTQEARAADPHLSPDGSTIACTVQRPDGRALATLRIPPGGATATPAVLLSQAGVDFAGPRWSPDGRTIAAERRQRGGPSEIALVEAATGRVIRTIGDNSGRNTTPAWSRDGRLLYFAAARGREPFQLHSADPDTGEVRRLTNAGSSAQSPDVSPDGSTLVFVGYTADGFDLFSIALADAEWEAVPAISTQPQNTASTAAADSASAPAAAGRPYNPWPTLVPRFWTPIVEIDNEALTVGGATGAFDALGRHGYLAGATWSTRARPDWYGGYAYDRWRPTLFVDVSEDTDAWREGTSRITELNAGALIRIRRMRRAQMILGSFHSARETFDCAPCSPPVDATFARRAIRLAWSTDAARRFGYSISDEEGYSLTASTEFTREALGASGDATAVIVDGRAYFRAGPRHAAFALRAAGASAWGDRDVRRSFAAGGTAPQSGGIDFGLDAVGLVRGFETDDGEGRRAAVVNIDYRFPLVWLERGIGTWPLFARSLHGAVFTDAGAAWTSRLTRTDRRASAGLELAADVILGYSVPLTAAAGVAWRYDPTGRSRGATFFARIGRAF